MGGLQSDEEETKKEFKTVSKPEFNSTNSKKKPIFGRSANKKPLKGVI